MKRGTPACGRMVIVLLMPASVGCAGAAPNGTGSGGANEGTGFAKQSNMSEAATSQDQAAPDPPSGMVRIVGGAFMMGRADGPKSEGPPQEIEVKSFWIDRHEVTTDDYASCVEAEGCVAPKPDKDATYCNWGVADRSDHPINCVDWNEAKAYCKWKGRRLPSEAEWEFAARGTEGRSYPWGETIPSEQLCWKRFDSKEGTCATGSFSDGATPEGVFDLSGNVSEWTSSSYCPYSAPKCDTADISGRGGSWDYSNPNNMRATSRAPAAPSFRRDLLGFRCAASD